MRRRPVLAVVAAIFALTGVAASCIPDPPPVVSTEVDELVFNDEFDGVAVNTSKWNVQHDSTFGDGNNEEQRYMRENVVVQDGTLRLIARDEPTTGKRYTSGMVTTRAQGGPQRFAFTHGYAEVRARLPKGGGYWPAFWLVGGEGAPGWPAYGEVDVFEGYGTDPEGVEATFHWSDGGQHRQEGGRLLEVDGGQQAWHTYGVLWTADELRFVIDGEVRQTFTPDDAGARAALGYPHTMILNLAVGGDGPRQWHGWDGSWSAGELPGTYEIDYVRVWQ